MCHDAAEEYRRTQFDRQVDADSNSKHRCAEIAAASFQNLVDDDNRDCDADTDPDHVPGQITGEHAFGDRAHQCCLRSLQGFARIHTLAREYRTQSVSLEQQLQHRCNDDSRSHYADDLHDLLFDRSSADDSPCFQVLHVVAGNGCRTTNDRADKYCCRCRSSRLRGIYREIDLAAK